MSRTRSAPRPPHGSAQTRPRALLVVLAAVVAVIGLTAPTASAQPAIGAQNAVATINPAPGSLVEGQGPVSPAVVEVPGPLFDDAAVVSLVTPRGLATGPDEAVFWSGIRGGDSTATAWVSKNGGSTLETTVAQRGVSLPAWDAGNPAAVAAWRNASREFAAGASGKVRVLQADAVRVNSIWAQVEFPALKANPNVTSITSIDPRTGAEVLLWSR